MTQPSQDIALYNNDLYTVNGDFAIMESDEQHVSDTLAAFPSWWKENPADGVGMLQYINSSGQEQTLARSAKIQLQSDGYKISNPKILVDATGLLTVEPNAQKQ